VLDRLQGEANTHSQVMKKYKELESNGFGFEFKLLTNMVKVFAVANKMSPYEATEDNSFEDGKASADTEATKKYYEYEKLAGHNL
jgi:hypothetical protein